jgi:hypothetical protein
VEKLLGNYPRFGHFEGIGGRWKSCLETTLGSGILRGAGIGVNLNQASGTGTTPMSFSAASSAGVTYALDYLPQNTRLVVGDSATDYCVNLQSQSGTIPWQSFNSACWGTSGVSLSGPPANLVSVRFQVVADTAYGNNTSFTFCISQLSL